MTLTMLSCIAQVSLEFSPVARYSALGAPLIPVCKFSATLLPFLGMHKRRICFSGAAGASGENSVAVVQFNNQEWMVELVTQPGRMYQLKKGTIPQMSDEVLWGQKGTPGVAAGAVHKPHEQASASSYPTMPRPDTEVSDTGGTEVLALVTSRLAIKTWNGGAELAFR